MGLAPGLVVLLLSLRPGPLLVIMTRKETSAARRQRARRQATSGDRGPASSPPPWRAQGSQGSRDIGPAGGADRGRDRDRGPARDRDRGPARDRVQKRARDLSPGPTLGADLVPAEKRNPDAKAFLGGVPPGTQLGYVQQVLREHFQTNCYVDPMLGRKTGSGDLSYAVFFNRPKTMHWACNNVRGLPRPWALRKQTNKQANKQTIVK